MKYNDGATPLIERISLHGHNLRSKWQNTARNYAKRRKLGEFGKNLSKNRSLLRYILQRGKKAGITLRAVPQDPCTVLP